MQRTFLFVISSSLLMTGCWSTNSSSPAPASPTKAAVGGVTGGEQTDAPVQPGPSALSGDVRQNDPVLPRQPREPLLVELASPGVPPEPVRSAARFLLLTGEGPLVIEASFRIDGYPSTQVLQQLLDKMLELADSNGDGVALWDEVLESPHFRFGQFGNVVLNNFAQKQQARRQYDTNLNGRFDRAEVPAFLTQNKGSSQAFQLLRSAANRGSNKSHSPVMRVLDYDEDGRLGRDEISQASSRLQSRDADADEILLPSDFVFAPGTRGGMRRGRRRYGPDSAILLGEHVDWDQVSYAMQEIYGGDLAIDTFRLVPELHASLDLDVDGQISDLEVKGFNSVAASIRLHLEFGRSTSEGDEVSPRVRLMHLSTNLERHAVDVVETERRITLQWARFKVAVYINDALGAIDNQMQARSQFEQADADSNGYLEASEFPENLVGEAPFAALDQDGDGRLYLKDFAEILGQRQAVVRSQIVAQAEDQVDALFSALDANNDGRLAGREVASASARLRELDVNQDEVLRSRELPDTMGIVFARGVPAARDGLLNVANLTTFSTATATDAPQWFRRMDGNADGDISAAEFLGTANQFRDLDANADGFLSLGEVQALASSGERE